MFVSLVATSTALFSRATGCTCAFSRALIRCNSSSQELTISSRVVKENKLHQFTACSKLGLDPSKNRFHAPIVYHERYSFKDWPQSHTFPMDKFRALANCLVSNCKKTNPEHSMLSRPLVKSYDDFFRPIDFQDVDWDWFQPVDSDFLHRFLSGCLDEKECRYIGFREQTSRPELIERTVLEVMGTILTCQLALKYGIASNAAGGTHHATPTSGAGYTILNDLAIAANYLTSPQLHKGVLPKVINKVLVIDCDVHQGDGTAKFAHVIGSDRLITLSLHCKDNYPFKKAHSFYDIDLPAKTSDEFYMKELEAAVTRAIEETNPDFILYDAGVDVYKYDTLGKFHISLDGLRKRDRFVLETCAKRSIPVASVIGGGYDKNLNLLSFRHAIVHEESAYVWRKYRMWES